MLNQPEIKIKIIEYELKKIEKIGHFRIPKIPS